MICQCLYFICNLYSIYIYIHLRKSRHCLLLCLAVGLYVCMSNPRFFQFALGSCYAVHIKRIVDIMKVYIERNNMQVELIRFRKKYRLYSRLRREDLYVCGLFATWQHASRHCSKSLFCINKKTIYMLFTCSDVE